MEKDLKGYVGTISTFGELPPMQVLVMGNEDRNLAVLVDFEDVKRRAPDYAPDVVSCDICRCELAGRGMFVDGRLRADTRWAFMCSKCFGSHGTRLGCGHGQLFAKQSDGAWRLVSGFCDE
jgi:hypothetical protein